MSKETDQFPIGIKDSENPDGFYLGNKGILSGFSEFLEPCDAINH